MEGRPYREVVNSADGKYLERWSENQANSFRGKQLGVQALALDPAASQVKPHAIMFFDCLCT